MNDNFLFVLNTLANVLQIENYNLNLKDATNTEINKHLQLQDKILSENIEKKLDRIIEQNNIIIKLLKKSEWILALLFYCGIINIEILKNFLF